MSDNTRERLGRYEILAELGRGAMGIVYKARDPKINRVVAVKTISLAGQPAEEEQEYRDRFFREAEAAGRVSHPGIVTIFDIGEEPETRTPYIVMEFVAGKSLEKLLLSQEDRKLPPEKALQLAVEIAEALDCAHTQGVVHRDIKPANILLTEDGHAKIADFGVAKLGLANATAAGRTLGTPAYMSPEQLNGEAVDGRSDLFSLGVILYTSLTGYRPFQGNSALTVAYKVVNRDPIPATVLDTELAPELDAIISRAMAKDPLQRYQRGMEMVADIQQLRAAQEASSQATEQAAGGTTQTGAQKPLTAALGPSTGTGSRAIDPNTKRQEHGAVLHLLETMRSKSFASAVLAIGLIVLAVRAGQLISPRSMSPRTVDASRANATIPVAPSVAVAVPASKPLENSPETHVTARPKPNKPKAPRVVASRESTAKIVPPVEEASPVSPAMLEIEVEHKFPEAHLSVWVDDKLSFTHDLEGEEKKRLVVFHRVQGHEFHAVQIPPGKHSLRVQVTSEASKFDQSASVAGDFATGVEKMLRVQFSKAGQMLLTLE